MQLTADAGGFHPVGGMVWIQWLQVRGLLKHLSANFSTTFLVKTPLGKFLHYLVLPQQPGGSIRIATPTMWGLIPPFAGGLAFLPIQGQLHDPRWEDVRSRRPWPKPPFRR